MQFEGEHLWIGQVGHIFVLIAFTASLLSTLSFFTKIQITRKCRHNRLLDKLLVEYKFTKHNYGKK
jgi:hypothetical protein